MLLFYHGQLGKATVRLGKGYGAVCDANSGLIDADLGGGLIKPRIPRKGQGKSGGYRIVTALQFAPASMRKRGAFQAIIDARLADVTIY